MYFCHCKHIFPWIWTSAYFTLRNLGVEGYKKGTTTMWSLQTLLVFWNCADAVVYAYIVSMAEVSHTSNHWFGCFVRWTFRVGIRSWNSNKKYGFGRILFIVKHLQESIETSVPSLFCVVKRSSDFHRTFFGRYTFLSSWQKNWPLPELCWPTRQQLRQQLQQQFRRHSYFLSSVKLQNSSFDSSLPLTGAAEVTGYAEKCVMMDCKNRKTHHRDIHS